MTRAQEGPGITATIPALKTPVGLKAALPDGDKCPRCRSLSPPASVAQWIEHRPSNPMVAGSSPVGGTTTPLLKPSSCSAWLGSVSGVCKHLPFRAGALRCGDWPLPLLGPWGLPSGSGLWSARHVSRSVSASHMSESVAGVSRSVPGACRLVIFVSWPMPDSCWPMPGASWSVPGDGRSLMGAPWSVGVC